MTTTRHLGWELSAFLVVALATAGWVALRLAGVSSDVLEVAFLVLVPFYVVLPPLALASLAIRFIAALIAPTPARQASGR